MITNDDKSKRKVDTEELTKRLFYQQEEKLNNAKDKRQKILKENETRLLWTNKKLTRDGERGMVDRVYTQQIQRMVTSRDKNQKMLEEAAKAKQQKQLSQAELTDVVSRMYTTEVERRRAHEESLSKKYQPPPVKRTLDSNKVKEVNARLYEDANTKREETRARLSEKHTPPDLPPIKKLTTVQQTEMALRLSAKS